jgi:hypothetical protein
MVTALGKQNFMIKDGRSIYNRWIVGFISSAFKPLNLKSYVYVEETEELIINFLQENLPDNMSVNLYLYRKTFVGFKEVALKNRKDVILWLII